MTRIEKDPLGEMELPENVLYGIQTARAAANFPVSGLRAAPEMIEAYVLIKKAAARTNLELKVLEPKIANAIIEAADDVLAKKYQSQFVVDVYQAGAGTSFNMNVNEVLANKALELLGRPKGEYSTVGPNDHVNMAQSTNDTYPTAAHLATIFATEDLLKAIHDLARAFETKGETYWTLAKSGRTHLMDALPVTLGDELKAYATALDRASERIAQRRDDLLELPIGGTAVGTGANAHQGYRACFLIILSELTGLKVRATRDSFEALQSRSQLSAFSSSLKELAFELIRIANDLRLLSSGPTTGLAEISLPAVQPGSSIMPGKVNPVMAECLDMVAFQVVGNDTVVGMAAQAGQLELDVMTPVMVHNILQSITILRNYLPVFKTRCVEGIVADEERCKDYLELNSSLATILSPNIGYFKAAEVAKEAQARKVPVMKVVVEKGYLSKEEAKKLLEPEKIAQERYSRNSIGPSDRTLMTKRPKEEKQR